MKGHLSLDRCPAPTRARGGTLRCVVRRVSCREPSHRRWDRVAPLMALVWWIRPWWPNALGRAQDRGDAHVCPDVRPCTACTRGVPHDQEPVSLARRWGKSSLPAHPAIVARLGTLPGWGRDGKPRADR